MGRRSNQTTKSGKFMNPADQQRKLERAKELKRNKKQRSLVRTAIMKNRDPDEILNQLRKMDEAEFESDLAPRVSAVEKREKLKKQYREIRDFFSKNEMPDKLKEVDLKMHGYEAERHRKMQQIAAIKFSMSGDMGDIPLPDATPNRDNAAMTPFLPSFAVQPAGLPMPPKKKVRFSARPKIRPPGPPLGIPPDLSDSEDEVEQDDTPLHDEDNFEPVMIPEDLLNDHIQPSTTKSALKPAPVAPPTYPSMSLAHAPPVHPSMLPLPPRMPIRLPPPPPVAFRGNESGGQSTISGAPTVSKPIPDAVISAKPELRDLAKESIRFIPTHLRVRREDKTKKAYSRTNAMGMVTESATKKAAKNTDEAYADFMKEMDGLL